MNLRWLTSEEQSSSLSAAIPDTSGDARVASHGIEVLVALVIVLIALRYYYLNISLLIPLLAASVLFAAWILRDLSEHMRWRRKMLLKSYRRELRRGESVMINGELLRYDTELTTYVLTVGVVLTDIRILSNYTVRKESLSPISFVYTFGSICLGWFSLFGPFTTFLTVVQNIRGSRCESVAMIIDRGRFRQFLREEIASLEEEERRRQDVSS